MQSKFVLVWCFIQIVHFVYSTLPEINSNFQDDKNEDSASAHALLHQFRYIVKAQSYKFLRNESQTACQFLIMTTIIRNVFLHTDILIGTKHEDAKVARIESFLILSKQDSMKMLFVKDGSQKLTGRAVGYLKNLSSILVIWHVFSVDVPKNEDCLLVKYRLCTDNTRKLLSATSVGFRILPSLEDVLKKLLKVCPTIKRLVGVAEGIYELRTRKSKSQPKNIGIRNQVLEFLLCIQQGYKVIDMLNSVDVCSLTYFKELLPMIFIKHPFTKDQRENELLIKPFIDITGSKVTPVFECIDCKKNLLKMRIPLITNHISMCFIENDNHTKDFLSTWIVFIIPNFLEFLSASVYFQLKAQIEAIAEISFDVEIKNFIKDDIKSIFEPCFLQNFLKVIPEI